MQVNGTEKAVCISSLRVLEKSIPSYTRIPSIAKIAKSYPVNIPLA